MISSLNPSAEVFVSSLQLIQNRISKDQQELTSGLRVSQASDDPDQICSILQLRAQVAGVQQTQQNLEAAGPQVESAESAIQQAIQLLDNATTLAAQAASSTTDADQQLDIAPQAQGILEQLVSLSQSANNGHYIFSGDQDQLPAYTLNLANGNGVQQEIDPGPPGEIADSNGVTFQVGLTAQQIFDDRNADGSYATDNVFAAVNGLLTSLQTGNTPGILQAVTNIKAAASHLNDESSFYGGVQNRITGANTTASQALIALQQQLSSKQDADAVSASLDLNASETNLQAAMSSEAMLKPQSLFNYLG